MHGLHQSLKIVSDYSDMLVHLNWHNTSPTYGVINEISKFKFFYLSGGLWFDSERVFGFC